MSQSFGIAVMLALLATACSDGRSVEAYCGELDDGFARMASNTDQAGDGGLDQFLVVVQNVGEMNRLLGRLADVAPDEIRGDVEAVAESWERQGEQIGQAASNPLGGLAQILVDSMLVSASTEAVENWTIDNCGRALFGPPPDRLLAADGTLESDDHVAAPLCPALGEPVTRESNPAELISALEVVADEGVESARALAERMTALEPAPATPWEALGRLWWDAGDDPGPAMLAVVQEVEEVCARPLIDEAFLDGFDEIGPRPLGDDRFLLGSYGQPCSTRTWQGYWTADQQPISQDGIVVMHCDDPPAGSGLTIHLLDLRDGVVSTVPVPAGNNWSGGPGQGTWPWITDGWMYWTEADELPASGLDPARERAQLFRAPTERPSDVELLWAVEGEDWAIASLAIVGAKNGNVLVLDGVYKPNATLRVFGPDGDPIAQADGHISGGPVIAWPGIVQYDEVIVDLTDATMRTVEPTDTLKREPSLEGPIWHRDACTGARFEHAFNPRAPLTRWELGPGRTLRNAVLDVDGRLPSGVLVPLGDGFVTMPSTRGFSGSYAHFGPDGELRWELPDRLVERAQVVNGQLFVVTSSDELIAVDTASGEESEADQQMLELARTLLDGGSLWIEPTTGEAEVRTGDVIEFLRLEDCASG